MIYIKELKSYVTDREKKLNKTEKREEEAKRELGEAPREGVSSKNGWGWGCIMR